MTQVTMDLVAVIVASFRAGFEVCALVVIAILIVAQPQRRQR